MARIPVVTTVTEQRTEVREDTDAVFVADVTTEVTDTSDGGVSLDDLAPAAGPVDFSQQQATGLRVENRTTDPASPQPGQIWLRTDL